MAPAEDRRPVPGQEVDGRDAQVGPADQAEDAPPVGSQLHPPGDLGIPVREGHKEEKGEPGPAQPGSPDPAPAALGRSPHEQDAEGREHVPHGGGEHAAHPVLGVDHEHAHDHECQGPREHVAPHLAAGLAAAQPPAEREGDRRSRR